MSVSDKWDINNVNLVLGKIPWNDLGLSTLLKKKLKHTGNVLA